MIFRVPWLARCRGARFWGTSRAGFLALLLCQLWGVCRHGQVAHRDNLFARANSLFAVPTEPCAAPTHLALPPTAVLQEIYAAAGRAAVKAIRAPLAASVKKRSPKLGWLRALPGSGLREECRIELPRGEADFGTRRIGLRKRSGS